MTLTEPHRHILLTTQATTGPSHDGIVAAEDLGRILLDLDLGSAYVAADDLDRDGTAVYTSSEPRERISLRRFEDVVADAGREYLSAVVDRFDGIRAARIRRTLPLLAGEARGSAAYRRTLAVYVRDCLDEIEPEISPAPSSRGVDVEARAAHRREQYRRRQEADERTLATILVKVLPHLFAPGRHSLADVWRVWVDAVNRSRKIPAGAARVGRTRFFVVLSEVAEIVTGRARARFLVVPEPAVVAEPDVERLTFARDALGRLSVDPASVSRTSVNDPSSVPLEVSP